MIPDSRRRMSTAPLVVGPLPAVEVDERVGVMAIPRTGDEIKRAIVTDVHAVQLESVAASSPTVPSRLLIHTWMYLSDHRFKVGQSARGRSSSPPAAETAAR